MKTLTLLFALLVFCLPVFCQVPGGNIAATESELPTQVILGGVAYNQYSDQQVNLWGSYAKRVSGPLYSFSSYDVTATDLYGPDGKMKLPTLNYSARTGVAIHLADFGAFSTYLLGDAGIAASSMTTAGAFSGGGFGAYRFRSGWGIVGALRIMRSAAFGTRYVPELGIAYGVKR